MKWETPSAIANRCSKGRDLCRGPYFLSCDANTRIGLRGWRGLSSMEL